MASTTEPQTNPSGDNDSGSELTATVDKRVVGGRNRGWYFILSDGTRSSAEHTTKKAAQAAAALCIEVRAMNAREDARRARLRAFVHPGCERVRLDELALKDRVWLVTAMQGAQGEMYPTRWKEVVIELIKVLVPGKSVMVGYTDPHETTAHGQHHHVLCVNEYVTIGANRHLQTSAGQVN